MFSSLLDFRRFKMDGCDDIAYVPSGSIKFVHQDCLLQWLNYSNARQCEICRYPFSFSPVYAENASRLSIAKFALGIVIKGCHNVQYLMRLPFVLSAWLLIVPVTVWLWRLAFVRSFGEAGEVLILSRHISATAILIEYCFDGYLLPASILFIFLGAVCFRDYFRCMVRLAFLVLVELGVFPLICGWWLDVCSFRMLGKTASLVVGFSSFSPPLAMHWTVGIIYMLQIGIYKFGICDVVGTLKCFALSVNY
ncbi:hypothetical protein C5167_012055 [Papaver somniferum]|uniref:RING-type E3 ubiquitin transferase n=1 Tax=Papaver somniferum TaxID=3469 RepID=A0A4Y7IWE7_PAPSO|nr:hypothetical protein C5167_012055 [Papaver somniferum]